LFPEQFLDLTEFYIYCFGSVLCRRCPVICMVDFITYRSTDYFYSYKKILFSILCLVQGPIF